MDKLSNIEAELKKKNVAYKKNARRLPQVIWEYAYGNRRMGPTSMLSLIVYIVNIDIFDKFYFSLIPYED